MGLDTTLKNKIVKKYQLHENDTGSPQVQIALLTERINELTKHLSVHKKDFHSRRGLLQLVGKRRNLIKYLEKSDPKSLKKVLKDLKIE